MTEDSYKRVTRIQLELWMQDPTTQAYLSSIGFYEKDVEEGIKKQSYLDPQNNDATCNALHFRNGCIGASQNLSKPVTLMEHYGMVELEGEVTKDGEIK